MKTTSARSRMQERIDQHGRQLLKIFRRATDRDPDSLCRRLRRLEATAAAIGLQWCNGPEMAEGESERRTEAVLAKVRQLLGNTRIPIFVNLDPRGYALKIRSEYVAEKNLAIHRDWGGCGILAPDLRDS